MSSSEATAQGHGVTAALEAQAATQDHGVPALEAQDGTDDHGVMPGLEAPTPEATDEILAAVARLARRRRLAELRRQGRTASAGAEEGEAAKRVRPVSDASGDGDSSRESAKVAPEPQQEGGSAVVAPLGGWPKSVSHGATSVIGRRREMEDAFAVAAPFLVAAAVEEDRDGGGKGKAEAEAEAEAEFFAVYDGHGGSRVADACRERLHVVLAEEVARLHLGKTGGGGGDDYGVRWRAAMEACFARVDDEVAAIEREANKTDGETVGSTAVVVVVGPRHIVVANCGDSRAVLSRGGVPVPLSSDHKPDRPDELERVESAGGRVINWNGHRVLGVLATSRSIGDYFLKPFVSAEPEVTVTERTNKDEFIILASDGLWDVMTNEVACKVARNCLCGRAAIKYPDFVKGSSASDAASVLAEFAMSRGSSDNISVVVVELKRLKRWKGGRQNGST